MRLLLLFLFGLQSLVSFCQSHLPDVDPDWAAAQAQYQAGNWENALSIAKPLLQNARYRNISSEIAMLTGDCHLELGDINQALEKYFFALEVIDADQEIQRAAALNKIGNAYNEVRWSNEAIPYLDSAWTMRSNLLGPTHLEVSHVLNNLGITYTDMGDYAQAEEYHREALAIRRGSGEDQFTAQSQNNLGLCLMRQGKLVEALARFGDAMAAYQRQFAPIKLADTYLNQGNAYSTWSILWEDSLPPSSEPSLVLAQRYYQKALHIYQAQDHAERWEATCINNLGNTASAQGDFQLAEKHHQSALYLRRKHLPKGHPEIADTYFNLGLSSYMQGLGGNSLPYFDSCIALTGYQQEEHTFDYVTDNQTLLYGLYHKGQIYSEQYASTADPNDLLASLSHFNQIDALLEYLFTRYESVAAKMGLAEICHSIYEEALQVVTLLYEHTQEERYAHRAFYFAEKSKGLILLEGLNRDAIESFHNIPKSTIFKLQELEQNISEVEKALFLRLDRGGATSIASLRRDLFSTKQELQLKVDEIASRYPDFYKLKYRVDPPTIPRLQRNLLKEDQSLLSYFMGTTHLWVFLISRDVFELKRLPISGQVDEVLRTFLNAINGFTTSASTDVDELNSDYVAAARYLHDLLVLPVSQQLQQRLIIIPDGLLNFIPFDALLTKPVIDQSLFRDHPYLVNDHSISYNYSVRLWEEMWANTNVSRSHSYLGLAPSFAGGEEGVELPPLRHNQTEVKLVQETMDGDIFLADAASKKTFLRELPEHDIIHLATHGMAHPDSDQLSFLAFTRQDDETVDDSRLYVSEIYSLRVPADIVVLSACETAAGQLFLGEGIASLARSFSYAGAKSLVSTRWNVNDKNTQLLVDQFFKNLETGSPKDIALQKSISQFIQSSNHFNAHPYFWSAFMAQGNMESITASQSLRWRYMPWFTLALISSVFIYRILRTRKQT